MPKYDYVYGERQDDGSYTEPSEGGSKKVLEPGEYKFRIKEVFAFEESKNGNEYLPMYVEFPDDGGGCYENLVFTDTAKFRIDQLLKSIGKAPNLGERVSFEDPRWLEGCQGWAKVKKTTQDRGKNAGKERNEIEAWLFEKGRVDGRDVTAAKPRSAGGAAPSATAQKEEEEDDNIAY